MEERGQVNAGAVLPQGKKMQYPINGRLGEPLKAS